MIYVAALTNADTVYAADQALVERGDTLGAFFTDPYRFLRADLLATLASDEPVERLRAVASNAAEDVVAMGTSWERDLRSLVATLADAPDAPVSSSMFVTRPSLPIEQRELLEAGKMGAEDGIRDLEAKLRFLSPPTTDAARERALEIAQQISKKRAYIIEANRKLRDVRTRVVRGTPAPRPQLTPEQRQRVESLAASIHPDTSYILAPVAGTFSTPAPGRVASVGIGAVQAQASKSAAIHGTSSKEEHGDEAYRLEATGLPVLWATARRSGAGDSTTAAPGPVLIVSKARDGRDTFKQLSAAPSRGY